MIEELTQTPDTWDVFSRLAVLPHAVFFDSVTRHPTLGRYSFVAADPFEWIWSRGKETHVQSDAVTHREADPFSILAGYIARFREDSVEGLPSFQGGAAGLFGYDLCHHLECLPRPRLDEFRVPDMAVGIYDCVVAFDHVQGRAWLISTGFPETDRQCRRQRAERRLRELASKLKSAPPEFRHPAVHALDLQAENWPAFEHDRVISNFSQAAYLKAVGRALEYIHAGDCFQVNLAQRLLHPADIDALELYRRLRERNPATFAGYLDMGDFVIASASPERFVRLERGEVETRPIKGTRPRVADPEEDRRQVDELLASPKDRAENIMIVDLLRNDLGRVCRYGSVRVAALCRLESYQFVHHLVSEVRGRLGPGLGAVDLLRASFPGGSVTGAPKIRAMEIIAELEPTARGPYCGCLGYLGFDGGMDTNILIRTFTHGRGWIQFPVGGGIVADSTPEREYEETRHKAEGMLRAFARATTNGRKHDS
ncbi:MAG TPA: aminodeoxychorismate synthase component I [Gemmataceae bacterium]|nr:aminodeoxychorismate synthase component I [Gemmataceae bacterium]